MLWLIAETSHIIQQIFNLKSSTWAGSLSELHLLQKRLLFSGCVEFTINTALLGTILQIYMFCSFEPS